MISSPLRRVLNLAPTLMKFVGAYALVGLCVCGGFVTLVALGFLIFVRPVTHYLAGKYSVTPDQMAMMEQVLSLPLILGLGAGGAILINQGLLLNRIWRSMARVADALLKGQGRFIKYEEIKNLPTMLLKNFLLEAGFAFLLLFLDGQIAALTKILPNTKNPMTAMGGSLVSQQLTRLAYPSLGGATSLILAFVALMLVQIVQERDAQTGKIAELKNEVDLTI